MCLRVCIGACVAFRGVPPRPAFVGIRNHRFFRGRGVGVDVVGLVVIWTLCGRGEGGGGCPGHCLQAYRIPSRFHAFLYVDTTAIWCEVVVILTRELFY